MCQSMVDIHSATAEIRQGKKIKDRKKPQDENIMACPFHRAAIKITDLSNNIRKHHKLTFSSSFCCNSMILFSRPLANFCMCSTDRASI